MVHETEVRGLKLSDEHEHPKADLGTLLKVKYHDFKLPNEKMKLGIALKN